MNENLARGETIDRFGQGYIPFGHPARVMAREPEIDPIPYAGELRVVIHFLRMKCDAAEEAERFTEILELEAADQRLAAVLERPAWWSVHASL